MNNFYLIITDFKNIFFRESFYIIRRLCIIYKAKSFKLFWQVFKENFVIFVDINRRITNFLSFFFSGLRVSVSYAVVGAVISEWLGGFEGLGVYMTRVRKAYAFDRMFAVILFIVAVSLLLMALVTVLRRRACPWEAYEKIERND